jgi:hypothetical protein
MLMVLEIISEPSANSFIIASVRVWLITSSYLCHSVSMPVGNPDIDCSLCLR